MSESQRTRVADVGGTAIKLGLCTKERVVEHEVIATRYPMRPHELVDLLVDGLERLSDGASRVSVGFPGMVRKGVIRSAPHFVTRGGPGLPLDPTLVREWDRDALTVELAERLGCSARTVNDADMHGLAFIEGSGTEVVITFGTGIGTGVYVDGMLAPHLELAQHPFLGNGTYNDYAGDGTRKLIGDELWRTRAVDVINELRRLVFADRVYVGGGNARLLEGVGDSETVIVGNMEGLRGGVYLWDQPEGIL